MRLVARGVSPLALRPLNVDEVDVSTPSGRSAILLGMMSYFFIFALLMGGMYLAIDTTAGERERGSLEPLLALPVTRGQLMLGKIIAKLEEGGLRVVAQKRIHMTKEQAEGFYAVHKARPFFGELTDFMSESILRYLPWPPLAWLPAAVVLLLGVPFCWRLLRL